MISSFHVKDAPGSHVILRGSKNSALFKDAMKYAAYFSSLRKASKVEVMVAFKKDVKKNYRYAWIFSPCENIHILYGDFRF